MPRKREPFIALELRFLNQVPAIAASAKRPIA